MNEEKNLQFSMNENGFINTEIMGNGIVEVRYTGTTLEKISNKIALGTLIAIAIYIVIDRIKYIIIKEKHIENT